MRGVDATVKLATAAPDGVKRSSGSAVRLPTSVMVVSPAMCVSVREDPIASGRLPEGSDSSSAGTISVQIGADHFGPHDLLVDRELAVQLLHVGRFGRQVDHDVDPLGLLADLIRQPATAPDVQVVHGATTIGDDLQVVLERRLD